MSKKYIPSGYQIINLGEITINGKTTITKNENDGVSILCDLYLENKLSDKPILLSFSDTNSVSYRGWVSIVDDIDLYLVTTTGGTVHIQINDDSIRIQIS